jgi:hypothetical protein
VTSTMPFFRPAASATDGGIFKSASDGIFIAMTRITIAKLPRCRKMLTRKRERSANE